MHRAIKPIFEKKVFISDLQEGLDLNRTEGRRWFLSRSRGGSYPAICRQHAVMSHQAVDGLCLTDE